MSVHMVNSVPEIKHEDGEEIQKEEDIKQQQ